MVVLDDMFGDYTWFYQLQIIFAESDSAGCQRPTFEHHAIFQVSISFKLYGGGFFQVAEFTSQVRATSGLRFCRNEDLVNHR